MKQNATAEDDLPPDQLRAVAALAAGSTVTDAASAAGVDRATVYRWLHHDPAFVAELNRTRQERAERLRGEVRGLASEAVEALWGLLADAETPPAVRLRAALAVIQASGGAQSEPIGPTEAAEIRGEMARKNLLHGLF